MQAQATECEPEQAAPYLLSVLGRKANPGGACTMADLLQGRCFLVRDDSGAVIAAYVLRGQGSEVWIQAGAGRANMDMCDLFNDLVAQHGAGFETIAFRTHRRGLVRKALQRGYAIADDSNGWTLTRKLT